MTARHVLLLRRGLVAVCLTLLGCAPSDAQTAVGGPRSGLLFDSESGAIRPVLGVPPSAYLGGPLLTGLQSVSFAPDGSQALGVMDGRLFLIRGLATFAAEPVEISGVLAAPDLLAWSGDSSAAAAYSASLRRLQLIRPGALSAEDVDISAISGEVAVLGLDSARNVVLGIRSGAPDSPGGLYLVSPGSSPSLLAAISSPRSLVFANREQDLFLSDLETQQVLQITGYRGGAAVQRFAGPDSGVAGPVGLGLTADGRRLFVANRDDSSLAVYDTVSQALVSRIGLEFRPSVFEPLPGDSLFLLSPGRQGEKPFQTLNASAGVVSLVPAGGSE